MTEDPFTVRNPERDFASVSYILTRGSEVHPDRVAIDDRLNGKQFTYLQLDQITNKLARMLLFQGIRQGDLVATMFANDSNAVCILFAAAKIGAVVCPVNIRLLPDEVASYLKPHAPVAIVCSDQFCDRFSEVPCKTRVVMGSQHEESWIDGNSSAFFLSDEAIHSVVKFSDPFRMIPTGGTTGVSKGVVHSHGGTLMTVLTNIAEFGIQRRWKTLLIAPAYHGAGMDWGLFPILWRGGTVIMPPEISFNASGFLDLVRENDVEFCLVVPAIIGPLFSAWDRVPITCVKTLVCTSAPTAPPLREKLALMFPEANLLAGAGISESLNMAIQSPGEFLSFPTGIGEPHLDTRLLIVDSDGTELPRGERGEICLRGFNTALYYHANPKASQIVWRKRKNDPEGLEWCFTGDVGVMDGEGRVTIVDRSKDVILTGGETVPSVEIEIAFAAHPAVKECAAIGIPDEKWGEAVTLVVAKSDPDADDEELAQELFIFSRSRLSGYKAPKQIVFIEALPRSHFGKALKRQLREMTFSRVHFPAGNSTLKPKSKKAEY